mmetsp:Transcript_29458/g.95030  ORF Transcript_29458/g.95030 Transcript_29458/m.95030 type:complete len:250 (+) Transcript_29458:1067-1816(+)
MQQMERSSGSPAARRAAATSLAISHVCVASSRDGAMISPNGPSPRVRGIRFSSSYATITIGSVKTRVLPEPVKAMPIMSRPERMTGSPWIWIGVGFLIPLACKWSKTGWGKRISWKVLIGGGISSPSTRMCHLSRTACRSFSLISRMWRGGRQPVFITDVYCTPLASSLTLISGLCWLSIDCSTCTVSCLVASASERGTMLPLASFSARSSSSDSFFGFAASSCALASASRRAVLGSRGAGITEPACCC